jgi:hypothetical protein
MPFTPYHFGPSGFAGLLLRRWVDVPVFVAANVLIDVEVLADRYFGPGWPVHQLWHFHTLLVGGLAGAIFGALVYYIKPLRWCSEKSMGLIGLGTKATLLSMVLAGVLGVWLHVLIDSCYHYDVQIFWPYSRNLILRWISRHSQTGIGGTHQQVEFVCLVFWGLTAGLYLLLSALRLRKSRQQRPDSAPDAP